MQLDNLSKEEVIALEVPTGAPIIYTFDGSKEPISKENLFE
jgi:bisphosphoglycerate-dependent phosphoglycerate mutase